MSALFERLQALFEEGHRADIPDLLSDERFADAERVADAAVLIAVTDRPAPGVILTQRPAGMRDHPGQVAFPGGKIDPGENAIEAALREAEEELAMQPAHVRVIGATDRYQTGTGFDITPVLGVVPPDLPLEPNPGEVDAWFEAPLDVLLARENWSEHEVFWRGATRRYLEYHHQGFRIWGVTAAIIANLSRRIEYRALFDA
ncbi:CoA pyrophosphatase [Pelagerythrobacter marinus]|uniref:CoA pyrophosphatase n=1 Tax=Pelagerythrobacter marinus TaxID=538382 RepID=UPI002036E9AC|nr:CoA pyrophosphatase [Pelagerythrobacter marinus]USA40167.1 CoA pyrophosphatase [Pelagerythrobacter marinus]WPZ05710.1 CoA pyrophosphatase [Pelagerythrobacter marinus]